MNSESSSPNTSLSLTKLDLNSDDDEDDKKSKVAPVSSDDDDDDDDEDDFEPSTAILPSAVALGKRRATDFEVIIPVVKRTRSSVRVTRNVKVKAEVAIKEEEFSSDDDVVKKEEDDDDDSVQGSSAAPAPTHRARMTRARATKVVVKKESPKAAVARPAAKIQKTKPTRAASKRAAVAVAAQIKESDDDDVDDSDASVVSEESDEESESADSDSSPSSSESDVAPAPAPRRRRAARTAQPRMTWVIISTRSPVTRCFH